MTERINEKFASIDDRITQRVVDGVRVVEKEMHRIIRFVGDHYVEERPEREPRLVIVDDASSNSAPIITRDRSSIAGLDAFIRSVFHTPAISK